MKYVIGGKVALRNQKDRMLLATARDMQRKYGDGPFTITDIETIGDDQRLKLVDPEGNEVGLTADEYKNSGSLWFTHAKTS